MQSKVRLNILRMKKKAEKFGSQVLLHPLSVVQESQILRAVRKGIAGHKKAMGRRHNPILRISLSPEMAQTLQATQDTIKMLDSKDADTVGKIAVIPHTPGAMSKSVCRVVEEGITIVSINPLGNVMGVLFSDGKESLFWYRSGQPGSDFGLYDGAEAR